MTAVVIVNEAVTVRRNQVVAEIDLVIVTVIMTVTVIMSVTRGIITMRVVIEITNIVGIGIMKIAPGIVAIESDPAIQMITFPNLQLMMRGAPLCKGVSATIIDTFPSLFEILFFICRGSKFYL